ncbi:hypothetical protein ACFSKI_00005 [Pseudogracilibacillus auburnensis]|uniref:hypothetical protein n=1 Tax=Pseudogracilibacillus auburnensis TaxID=1494959 RepID=UPI001314EAAE|nr:hypothetical protein [Pseudogracilibacillus auburnensis]MBO1005311.1 hypothetical protein [Pseudogracilibacillus auburnensis]
MQEINNDPWEGVFCFETQLDDTITKTESNLQAMGMDIVSEPITVESDNNIPPNIISKM